MSTFFEFEARIRSSNSKLELVNSHWCLSNTRLLALHVQRTNPALRSCKTSRPTVPAEQCKFKFNIYFSNDRNRWFFLKQGSGCSAHSGHCCLQPKQVKASTSTLDRDEYELALQQLQLNIPIASIRALLEERTDTSFTYDQINAIRSKAQLTLVLGDVSSPAERLMRNLEANSDIHYVVYTAHLNTSSLVAFVRLVPKPHSSVLNSPGACIE
jgi:hypothetical protein